MAAINDLIAQIQDENLRSRIEAEMNRLLKQKKFGLVFEDHLPEACCLPEVPIRVGCRVAKKTSKPSEQMIVQKIDGNKASCFQIADKRNEEVNIDDLVCVATFGEPIYPYLEMLDKVEGDPDKDLWHTLIEADNYHALQLLCYLYAGMVDCIYIDPPYNTGARDWKYNNDYVDSGDQYRHSKWLSMIKRRLELAKILLNPKDSVLIVTIDEKEYLHLGCLLEEIFPEARIQMVSSLINPGGVASLGGFSRSDEYIFFIMFGESKPIAIELGEEWSGGVVSKVSSTPCWRTLRRRGNHDLRKDRPKMFYPLIVEEATGKILECGGSLPLDADRNSIDIERENIVLIWPLKPDGTEGVWSLSQSETLDRLKNGYIRTISKNEFGWTYSYLAKGEIQKVEEGIYPIIGRGGANNELILEGTSSNRKFVPGTQWRLYSHNARENGSILLNNILTEKRFSFPKSLYAVHDAIRFFVANKPNALIVDFFAGSGTTLQAVNLLNKEDGGNRRCIMVTNNEVSEAEAKELTKNGVNPGDEEWEKLGIARYVTWPRTVCSIEGHDINGKPLKGNYLGSDIPMSEGFKANAAFFHLGFLDKTSVALGKQFKKLLPMLWMKAGAIGGCPTLEEEAIPSMLIFPRNHFAVLTEEYAYCEFEQKIAELGGIDTVYIVTDSESTYREMVSHINCRQSFQLYRDYLDNFRINKAR